MNSDRPPETVRAYLDALQRALKGTSPGLISDALAEWQFAWRDMREFVDDALKGGGMVQGMAHEPQPSA